MPSETKILPEGVQQSEQVSCRSLHETRPAPHRMHRLPGPWSSWYEATPPLMAVSSATCCATCIEGARLDLLEDVDPQALNCKERQFERRTKRIERHMLGHAKQRGEETALMASTLASASSSARQSRAA